MNNEVWRKTAQFLKELRCENVERSTSIELSDYRKALEEKARCRKEYEKIVMKVTTEEKKKIQQYADAVENCAEEENKQAYIQGIIDSILIMSGIGLLPSEERILDIINYIR